MSRTIIHYRLRCVTEDRHEYVWLEESEGEPTVCPVNAAHTIDSSKTAQIDRVTQEEVAIKEEFVPTQGYYQSKGYEIDIDANVGSYTIMSHSWPYQITMLMGWFIASAENVGDKVEAYVASDIITGAIQAPVAVNDTTITVTPTVIENTAIGYYLKLFDGVNQSDLGRVLGVDSANSQITVETGSDQNFSPLSPTYVQQTIKVIDDMFINHAGAKYSFAEKKMGGKAVPPGITFDIRYLNRTGGAKKFCYNMEFMY